MGPLAMNDRVNTDRIGSDAGGRSSTLTCPACGLSLVVRRWPASGADVITCHGTLLAGSAVPCGEVAARMPGQVMVAGSTYVDSTTGLMVRCTRGGPRLAQLGSRPLTLRP
jgi:hypothetical protein